MMFNESDDDIDAPSTSTPRGESTHKLGHRTQKYRTEWEQLPGFKNWLGPVKDNITKAYCCYCKREMVSEITTIKKHAASLAHSKNVKSITGKSITNIFKKVDDVNEVKKINQIKRAEILICGFLSEHNISFNTADHLTQILKKAFPDSDIAKKIVLGRTKATKIVTNVIGKNHKEELVKDLKNTTFSVIIDESTDVGTLKTLCICVRYFNPTTNKIMSRFWELIEVFKDSDSANEGATASKIYTEVINSFRNESIPLENIIGFASDGCNTMFGPWNSVASRFKEDFPGVMVQKCICHSLALCASEACKILPRR